MSASATQPVRSSPAISAFIPSLKPGRRLLSHSMTRLEGIGLIRLPLRSPDCRAAHCLSALATHPARLELASVPVRSSPAVEALGAEVCVAFLRPRRPTIVFVINRVCRLIVNRKGME
jgi:hypothetical protein